MAHSPKETKHASKAASVSAAPTVGTPASTDVLRVAVLSDLHMFSAADPGRAGKGRERPSFLCTDAGHYDSLGDPVTHLTQLIHEEKLEADLLLCAGDIADMGSETGIRDGWQHVRGIATALGVAGVAGTPGNHDIRGDDPEPEGCLKALVEFPVAADDLRNQFWSDHFAILEDDAYRLIVLNSCAYRASREFGQFEERSMNQLRNALAELQRKPVQILLCHHHPHQHSEYELGELDFMRGGQRLLDLLGRNGNWLVVHGHKHHPKLSRAAGHNSAPWVLAAGSLSALPNPALQGHARNQFYMLEFRANEFGELGWGGVGQAWDWATGDGWVPAGMHSGLPARFGFGYAGDLELLAKLLQPHVPDGALSFIEWKRLCDRVPLLNRLTTRDIEALGSLGFGIEYGEDGVPLQIARSS